MTTPALVSAGTVAQAVDSVQPAFGQSTTAGNLLLAFAQSNDSNSVSAPISIDSTSAANGWTVGQSMGSAYNYLCIWYKADCGSGETAPTFSNSGFTINAGLSEFSDVATSSPMEWGGNALQSDPCYEVAYDNYAGDLIVALSCWNGPNAAPTLGQTFYGADGSALSSTVIQSNSGDSPGSGLFYIFSYAIGDNPRPASPAPNYVSASTSEYENYVTSLIISFKAA